MCVAMEKHEARRQNIRDNPRSLFGAAGKGVESIPFLAIFPCKAKNPEPVLWGQTQATTLEETPFPLPQREHKYTQSMGSIIMGVFLIVSLGIDCPDYALLFLVFGMFQMIFFSSSFFLWWGGWGRVFHNGLEVAGVFHNGLGFKVAEGVVFVFGMIIESVWVRCVFQFPRLFRGH